MCGLNVTDQALVTPDIVARLTGLGTDLGRICAELMTFFGTTYQRLWGFEAPPLHDPVAVARVIDPSIVHCVDANAEIELRGEHTRGATSSISTTTCTGRPTPRSPWSSIANRSGTASSPRSSASRSAPRSKARGRRATHSRASPDLFGTGDRPWNWSGRACWTASTGR
jgi:inosine-uridine preferring nucleoside hydrolase